MIHLSDSDIVFFEKPANWRGALTYDLTVAVAKEIDLPHLNQAAIKCGALHLLSGSTEGVPIKTILQVSPEMPLIGLLHTFIYRPYQECSTYQMSIFPSQFQRFTDFAVGTQWSKLDQLKVVALHTVLINIVNCMAAEVKVLNATIADQSQEWLPPSEVAQAICLHRAVAEILKLKGRLLAAPNHHMVAIELKA